VESLKRLSVLLATAAFVLAASQPAAAFNMRKALQAVENLGQWSVMAQKCGASDSATDIRVSLKSAINTSQLSQSQRHKLHGELQYWVKTINRNFSTGGLAVETACPIWQASGKHEVKKEFSKLHQQLG
jgi:hypothetical protein